ncbi:MAG: aminopeptidase [Aggregatilineales bacterium]
MLINDRLFAEKERIVQASEFERNLEKYAEVIVKVGLNLQPGQRLLIHGYRAPAEPEAIPLVRQIALKAYEAGVRFVDAMFGDEQLNLIRFQHAPRDSFEEFQTWLADARLAYVQRGDAILAINGHDPDLLSDQDPALIATLQRAMSQYTKTVQELLANNATPWLVIAVPTAAWSAKVFPNLPPEKRDAKLWDAIFKACRIKQADPVAGWRVHGKELGIRSDYLTGKRYTALKYTAPGTKLTVGLPAGHIWQGGGSTSQNGISFVPNIPTEEVFTLPHKDQTEGVVSATKPLSVNGTLIDKFSLTFEAGRVVNAVAEQGESNLRRLLDTDENARRIGEVALVPDNSPISQSGLVFYNTLFDENASNHIALGNAYPVNLKGGEGMSAEAFAAAGGNQSLIHVDFMIGSGQMDVDGITQSGTTEPVMRDGNWAFDV